MSAQVLVTHSAEATQALGRRLGARVEAGDLIIFTEALVHGTMEWTAEHERRSLLYKYSPGHSSWSRHYYDMDDYQDLTEQQQRFLMPPFIGEREDTVQEKS